MDVLIAEKKSVEDRDGQAKSYARGFAVHWKNTFQYVRMSFCPEIV